MVSGTKFFIHGGGRWRELDTNDGCVEGWRKPRIVYKRHGKLVVAKTRAVLSGLRDLAAGRSGLVRDGAHIPFVKTEVKEKNKKDESLCDSSRCCQHANNRCLPKPIQVTPVKKFNIEVQCTAKIDAGIQTSQSLLFPEFLTNTNSRKRRHNTTSSDENVPTNNATKAVIHTETSRKSKRAKSDARSDVAVSKDKVPRLMLEKADSAKYNLYKRRRSNSTESIVWVVLPKNKDSKTDSEKQLKSSTKQNVIERESPRKRSSKCTVTRTKDQKVQKSFTEHRLESQSNEQTQDSKPRQDQCKELIIDDNDVLVLRNYLLNHTPGFNLLKFDEDDNYKKHFFFKINPLVNVERCPKIARLLKLNKRDDVSLKDFASMLGLMSVSSKLQPKRYKMRKLKTKRSYLDSVTNKENSLLVRNPKISTKSSNARDKVNEIHESSSDSETETDLSEDRTVRKSQRLDKSQNVSNTVNMKSYETRLSIENNSKSPKKLEYSQIKKTVSKNLEKLIEEGIKKNASNKVKISSKKPEVKPVLLEHKTRRSHSNSSNSGTDEEPKSKKTLKKNRINSDTSIEDTKILRGRRNVQDVTIEISESSDENGSVLRMDVKNALNINNSHTAKSNKYKKSLSPQNKNKNLDLSESDVFVSNSKPSHKGNKTQIRNDSTSDNSDFVGSRSSKIRRDKNKDAPKINKVRNRNLTDERDESSRDNSPSNYDRRVKNKANNKHRDIIDVSSDEKSPNKNRRVQNKKNRDTSRESSDENRPSNNDRRIQNKANKEIVRNKQNYHISNESSDEISPSNKRKRDKNKANEKNLNKSASDDNGPSTYDKRAQNSHKINKDQSEKENVNTNVFKNSKNNKSQNDNTKNRSKNDEGDERNLDKYAKSSELDKKIKNGREISVASRNIKDKHPQRALNTNLKALALMTNSISKRPLSTNPYSNLEDHAIVTWISSGGRACCVNGNRIWRELQGRFEDIAGQTRSWHSLRNRYLRYILPSLGSMALPMSQVSRLRAAAATGEIKARKHVSRRNSIFQAPERGALSRRPARSRSTSGSVTPPPPKRHKHDHTARDNPRSPKTLRSSQPSPPRALRYSDITRKFAETHRHNSTPSNSPTPKNSPNKSDRNTTKNPPSKTDKTSAKKSSNTNRSSRKNSSDSDSISTNTSNKSDVKSRNSPILESKTRNSARNTSTSMKSQSETSVKKTSLSLRRSFRLETLESSQKQAKSPDKASKTRKLFNPASLT